MDKAGGTRTHDGNLFGPSPGFYTGLDLISE